MKELSNKEASLVVGGGRGGEDWQDHVRDAISEAKDLAKDIRKRNWFGILTHSEELNSGEQEYLDNMRREADRHGYNNSQGGYRRGSGGREIEH
ncbi:hypothetical protein [Vibrio sp. OPT20]|uniref:hypothetical protein n=1 Tax=Vibrio sp. OPT20 TaxID=2778642 RepID=UPI00187F8A9D|nr:hypothetical protein [Vibrio sp. OPT20]MBE8564738.1 hypothetical protein [Vibrio sp. OPT20]